MQYVLDGGLCGSGFRHTTSLLVCCLFSSCQCLVCLTRTKCGETMSDRSEKKEENLIWNRHFVRESEQTQWHLYSSLWSDSEEASFFCCSLKWNDKKANGHFHALTNRIEFSSNPNGFQLQTLFLNFIAMTGTIHIFPSTANLFYTRARPIHRFSPLDVDSLWLTCQLVDSISISKKICWKSGQSSTRGWWIMRGKNNIWITIFHVFSFHQSFTLLPELDKTVGMDRNEFCSRYE